MMQILPVNLSNKLLLASVLAPLKWHTGPPSPQPLNGTTEEKRSPLGHLNNKTAAGKCSKPVSGAESNVTDYDIDTSLKSPAVNVMSA
jgi:hypothetical protein